MLHILFFFTGNKFQSGSLAFSDGINRGNDCARYHVLKRMVSHQKSASSLTFFFAFGLNGSGR